MMEHNRQEKSTLLLAFVIGLSTHGTFSVFFNSFVSFSIFPILTLILSIYCLHQRYLHAPMPDGLPKIVVGVFLLGLFLYATILRAEFSEMGSNFVPATFSVIIALWLCRAWIALKREQQELLAESEQE